MFPTVSVPYPLSCLAIECYSWGKSCICGRHTGNHWSDFNKRGSWLFMSANERALSVERACFGSSGPDPRNALFINWQ